MIRAKRNLLTLLIPREVYIRHGRFCSTTSWRIYTSWSDSWNTCGKLKIFVSVTKEYFTNIHIQQKWIKFVVRVLNYAFKIDYNWLRYGTTWSRVLDTVPAFACNYYSDINFLFESLLNNRQHNVFVALLSFLYFPFFSFFTFFLSFLSFLFFSLFFFSSVFEFVFLENAIVSMQEMLFRLEFRTKLHCNVFCKHSVLVSATITVIINYFWMTAGS